LDSHFFIILLHVNFFLYNEFFVRFIRLIRSNDVTINL
jgi:hypothetical protein